MKIQFTLILLFLLGISLQAQEDSSLDILNQAGMPNLEESWSMEEYNLAALILVNTVKEGKIELPHHKQPSFKLLEKLTNTQNYFQYKDTSLNGRFKTNSQFQLKIGELQQLYVQKFRVINGKLNYGKEGLLIMRSALYMTQDLSELGEIFLKKNPNLSDRQKAGLARYRGGVKNIILGCLMTIFDEFELYEEEDICSFSQDFLGLYLSLEKRLEPADKVELRKRILASKGKVKLNCIKESLEKL